MTAVTWIRARAGVLAIVAIAIAWGTIMHQMGWAQLGHYAEVRALADWRENIDPWHWESGDVAYIDGHYYSVKSPGTAALATLPYLAIEELGGLDLARDAAANAAEATSPRWVADQAPPFAQYGYNADRAHRIQHLIEDATPVVWALTLIVAVIPSLLLLLGVRAIADRLEPGFGTIAAVTLGLGTILSTFAAEFFSHAISTAIAFAAFAVLLRERGGPPRIALVAAAGFLAGLAVTFEVQVGLVGVVLFGLAIAREERLRRGAAYAAGAFAGALPHLLFNWWMLGSPFKLAYGDAVAEIGVSGHDEIGLNDDGFFGITFPRLDGLGEVLIGGRGLLVLTPVLVMAAVGVVLMHRRGRRAEALTIGGVALAYLLYNAAYWQPLGGGTPGPRFMTPVLPFLALGLAFAYRHRPATTIALAVPSLLSMLVANLTYPLVGYEGSVRMARPACGRAARAHAGVGHRRGVELARSAARGPGRRRCRRSRRRRHALAASGTGRRAALAVGAGRLGGGVRAGPDDHGRPRHAARWRRRRHLARARGRHPGPRGRRGAPLRRVRRRSRPGACRARARRQDLVGDHAAVQVRPPQAEPRDRAPEGEALGRADQAVGVKNDARDPRAAQDGDARGVGKRPHRVDHVLRVLGLDARAAVHDVGEPVGRPEQVAAVVLGRSRREGGPAARERRTRRRGRREPPAARARSSGRTAGLAPRPRSGAPASLPEPGLRAGARRALRRSRAVAPAPARIARPSVANVNRRPGVRIPSQPGSSS